MSIVANSYTAVTGRIISCLRRAARKVLNTDNAPPGGVAWVMRLELLRIGA